MEESILEQAIQYHKGANLGKAEELYHKVLIEQPLNADVLYFLGMIYFDRKFYQKAAKYIKQSLDIFPKVEERYNNLLKCCQLSGDADMVFDVCQLAINFAPLNANIYKQCLDILMSFKDIDRLSIVCSQIEKKFPNNDELLFACGCALQNCGSLDDAAGFYTNSIEVNPSNLNSMINLAFIYRKQEKFDQSIKLSQKIINLNDKLYHPYLNLAQIYEKQGQKSLALDYYYKVLQYSPCEVFACNKLVELEYLVEQNYTKVKKILENYIAIAGDNSQIYSNLAVVEVELGNFDVALKYAVKSIELMLNSPQANVKIKKQQAISGYLSAKALVSLDKLLEQAGIKCFIAFGTLLGFARSGDFLSFDKDIDVGVLDDSSAKIVDVVKKSREFDYMSYSIEDFKISVLYKNTIGIDIFMFKKDKGKLVAGLGNPGQNLLWEFSDFTLEKKKFVHGEFYAPQDYDRFLTEIYGNWKVEDKFFDSRISGKNLSKKSYDIAYACSIQHLCALIYQSRYEYAISVCGQIQERFAKRDYVASGFILKVKQALEKNL